MHLPCDRLQGSTLSQHPYMYRTGFHTGENGKCHFNEHMSVTIITTFKQQQGQFE